MKLFLLDNLTFLVFLTTLQEIRKFVIERMSLPDNILPFQDLAAYRESVKRDFGKKPEKVESYYDLVDKHLGGKLNENPTITFMGRFLRTKRSACHVGLTSYRKLTNLQAAIIVGVHEEHGFTQKECEKLSQTLFKPSYSRIKDHRKYNQNNLAKVRLLYKKASKITENERLNYRNLFYSFKHKSKRGGATFLINQKRHVEVAEGEQREISEFLPYSKGLHKITLEKGFRSQYRLYMAIMAVYRYEMFKTSDDDFFEVVAEQYNDMWHTRDEKTPLCKGRIRNIMLQMKKDGFWITKIKKRGNYKIMPWRYVVKSITGENKYSEKKYCKLMTWDFLGEIVKFESKYIYTRQIKRACEKMGGVITLFLSKKRLADEMGWKTRNTIKKYCDEFIDKINSNLIVMSGHLFDKISETCSQLGRLLKWHYKPIIVW